MAILPEFIFRAIIVRGITTIRRDRRFVDQLFRNLDVKSLTELRDFIENNRIHIDINYPRETLKVPAIVILLKQESEGQAFLNDTMGLGELPEATSYDGFENSDLRDEILGGSASVSNLSGEGDTVVGPLRVVAATNNTIRADSTAVRWAKDQFLMGAHTVHVVGGRGVGQQRTISTNGTSTIMVTENWTRIPDATSIFVVRASAPEVIGQPRAVYNRDNRYNIEKRGGLYNLSYQIQIVGQNPEITIYLHHIIKSIFTLARLSMEKQGIINMKMGASDFVPRPEYQPDFSYMRAMSVDFMYPFDIYVELQDLPTELRLVLEATVDGTTVDLTDNIITLGT